MIPHFIVNFFFLEIDLALDNIGEIEGDIIQYLKILMKLPEIA